MSMRPSGGPGLHGYYHPHTGTPAGAKDFSWTAALPIDLPSDGPVSPAAPT